MAPALAAGDCVLVDHRDPARVERGAVVVLRDPIEPDRTLVKRMASRGEHGFAVTSDDPLEARDSRHFGSVPYPNLIGRATLDAAPNVNRKVALTSLRRTAASKSSAQTAT